MPSTAAGAEKIPGLSVSASRDKEGKIHVTLCNLNPNRPGRAVLRSFKGATAKTITGRVLTASRDQAHNTFDQPETIKPAPFHDVKPNDTGFSATLPARSVVVLEVE